MKQLTSVLEHPEAYNRKDLEDAIRFLWPLLFPEYELRDPRGVEGVSDLAPHIFAQRDIPLTFIIAKVRRDTARSDAIRQLKLQVEIFHESGHQFPVYPIVFGPWEQKGLWEIVEPDQPGDYEVAILRVQELVRPLRVAADFALGENRKAWRKILGFDVTRLPPDARHRTETELLFWLLDCPVTLVLKEVRAYLKANISGWEPQLGQIPDATDREEGTGSDEDHSGGKP